MDIKKINEKVKDAKSFEEIKAILTDEELVYWLAYDLDTLEVRMADGDECLIKDILKVIGKTNYSIRHSMHLLDIAKELLLIIGRFQF